jgi:hypothetical protein
VTSFGWSLPHLTRGVFLQDGLVSVFSAEFDRENVEPVATFKVANGEYPSLSPFSQFLLIPPLLSPQRPLAAPCSYPMGFNC